LAPLNAQRRSPAGYVAVLRQAGADDKTIPHCLAWVWRFFANHAGCRRRDLGRAEIEAFLGQTPAHPGASTWQTQQAPDALELCCEGFPGIAALAPRPDLGVSSSSSPSSFAQSAEPVAQSPNPEVAPTVYGAREEKDKRELMPLSETPMVAGYRASRQNRDVGTRAVRASCPWPAAPRKGLKLRRLYRHPGPTGRGGCRKPQFVTPRTIRIPLAPRALPRIA